MSFYSIDIVVIIVVVVDIVVVVSFRSAYDNACVRMCYSSA